MVSISMAGGRSLRPVKNNERESSVKRLDQNFPFIFH